MKNSIRKLLLQSAAFGAALVALSAWAAPAGAATFVPQRYDDPAPQRCPDSYVRACSLREVILEAHRTSGSDNIQLMPGAYVLERPIAGSDTPETGDLDVVSGWLWIYGAGADKTIIDAQRHDRILDIAGGAGVVIQGVTIRHGQARVDNRTGHVHGGGIHNHGILDLYNSALFGNEAPSPGGGGLANAGPVPVLQWSAAEAWLVNVTIMSNIADTASGSQARGGGIENAGVLDLTNVTIAHNLAPVGGGIAHVAPQGGPKAHLVNTIVALNTPGGDCSGVITSQGHNLASDSSCALKVSGDRNDTDPRFAWPLQHADGSAYLLPLDTELGRFSRAIDTGSASVCAATDELGTRRPVDGNADGTATCDLGAHEVPEAPVWLQKPKLEPRWP
jgi:hypothetical protein